MKYVALLRGINVGGKNTIKMSELKTCFERLGFTDVSTYINSGNVIFSTSKPKAALRKKIEHGIKDTFNLNIPVVVRSQRQIADITKQLPDSWGTDKNMRTDVLFLWPEADYPDVINEIKTTPDVDNLIYTPGAIIWNFDRDHYKQSKMHNFIGTRIYKLMTARNTNTLRKLQSLMKN